MTDPSVTAPPGRAAEAARLVEAFDDLEQGRGGVLLLSGEGGVGKTTLSTWAVEEAKAGGAFVLEAPCFALSTDTPYACLVAAFGPVLRGEREADPVSLTSGLPSLGLLFEGVEVPPPVGGLQTDQTFVRSRLHGALVTLVSRLTAIAPVVLAIDDLHWADVATIEVVHALTNDLPDLPLLVLATVRPYESSERVETRRLLRALRPAEWASTIHVGGLDVEAVRALLNRRLGSVLPRRLVELVHRRSGGTPLVAEELVEVMIDAGALRPIGRRWELSNTDEIAVPAIADDLIGDRLERLGRESVELVATVAIAGEPAETALLAAVTGRGADGLHLELEALRRAAVIDRAEVGGGTAWVVHHPIIGEVAVSFLEAGDIAAIHLAFADQLLDAPIERRGRHVLGASALAREPEHLELLARAGRAAIDRGAPDEACRLLGAAFDAVDDDRTTPALRLDILWALGRAWLRRGETTVALHHLDRARALAHDVGDVVSEAGLLVDLQEWAWSGLHDTDGIEAACAEVLPRLEAAGKWVEAHRLIRTSLTRRLRAGEGASLEESLRDLDRVEAAVDDEESLLWGRHLRMLPDLQRLVDGQGLLTEVDALLARAHAFPELQRRILHERLDLLLLLGTRREIVAGIRAEREVGERLGEWPTWRIGVASWDVAIGEADLERTAEVEEIMGIEAGERPAAYIQTLGVLTSLIAGETPRAVTVERPNPDLITEHLAVFADQWAPDVDRRSVAAEAVRLWQRRRFIAGIPLVAPVAAGLGFIELGDDEGLAELLGVLESFDAGRGRTTAWARILRAEAATAPVDKAADYADAAARFELLDRPLDAAICWLTAAESGADVDPARLDRAAEVFESAPAPWMGDRLRMVAGRRAESAATPSTVDALGLTAREREVAEVVAEGLSNREVANRLYISVRTVTSHLDHIYTKLGIGSRQELAEIVGGAAT